MYELYGKITDLALSLRHLLNMKYYWVNLRRFQPQRPHSFSASRAEGGNRLYYQHNLLLLSQIISTSTKGAELQICNTWKLEDLSTVKSTTQCCNRFHTSQSLAVKN